jgi:hypothetical protein
MILVFTYGSCIHVWFLYSRMVLVFTYDYCIHVWFLYSRMVLRWFWGETSPLCWVKIQWMGSVINHNYIFIINYEVEYIGNLLQFATTCFGPIGHHQVINTSCKEDKKQKARMVLVFTYGSCLHCLIKCRFQGLFSWSPLVWSMWCSTSAWYVFRAWLMSNTDSSNFAFRCIEYDNRPAP